MSSLRQSRAADIQGKGSTTQPLALSHTHFLLGREGTEKLCQLSGSRPLERHMFLFVAGGSLGSSPQGKRAGTNPFSKSPSFRGLLHGPPHAALVLQREWRDWPRNPASRLLFSLFAEDTGHRLVSAVRIPRSPPVDEHPPLLPAPGERLASGRSVVCAESKPNLFQLPCDDASWWQRMGW